MNRGIGGYGDGKIRSDRDSVVDNMGNKQTSHKTKRVRKGSVVWGL